MIDSILAQLQSRALKQAEREGSFARQEIEYHIIERYENGGDHYQISGLNDRKTLGSQDLSESKKTVDRRDSFPLPPSRSYAFRCILQRSRPHHRSGSPDSLPFQNAEATQAIFDELGLPLSYFQICDGLLTTVCSYTKHDLSGKPVRYEFVAHRTAKQGDWALALSHLPQQWTTLAYLSVDDRIDSTSLISDIDDFRYAAAHPMLLPCIMFSATLKAALQRRKSLKERLQILEESIKNFDRTRMVEIDAEPEDYASGQRDLDSFFKILESCRKDQESRKGRYKFWQSYKDALDAGFKYSESVLTYACNDGANPKRCFDAHQDLKNWAAVTWQRLQSLKARDKDHITRVDNASFMLYKLIQQRDKRLQSDIARASQRDSEDMKFIALLGSVFLPAGLVASILNVQEFQFLPGPQLFEAYVGITVPLVALVVVICLAWPRWKRRSSRSLRVERKKFPARNASLSERGPSFQF